MKIFLGWLLVGIGVLAGSVAAAAAQSAPDARSAGGGECSANAYNCKDTPNPLPKVDEVWIERMTWMDVRDAMNAGKKAIIISTGGIEPNGPWVWLGKHNFILTKNCEAIARRYGGALCAPIVPFVPEGSIDPQSGHMRTAGTISLEQGTYEALLTDIVRSFKVNGFQQIFLIGDSGGNQRGMAAVAAKLQAQWKDGTVVAHIAEYYDDAPSEKHLRDKGVIKDGQAAEGLHDTVTSTLDLLGQNPAAVNWEKRVKVGKATINGVSIADLDRARALSQEIMDLRVNRTVDLMKKAAAARSASAK